MKPRLIGNDRTARNIGDSVPWKNVSGSTIPAYGVVQFRTNVADGLSQADKPNGSTGLFFSNGPVDVAANKAGESLLWNRPRLVLLDSAAEVGDVVGPVASSWEMSASGSGFVVIHQAVYGVGTVCQVGGGSSTSIIRFQIREADCDNRFAVAHVLSYVGTIFESFTIYGETELNEAGETVDSLFVYAYDKVGCYLNESNANLFGRIGYATYMYGTPKYPYQPWRSWEVTALAEQQTECEAF